MKDKLYKNKEAVFNALHLLPFIVCFLGIIFVSRVDGQLFPVINTFTITRAYHKDNEPNKKYIAGYFVKTRTNCKFEEIIQETQTSRGAVITSSVIIIDNSYDMKEKPVGATHWGDWSISMPKDATYIDLYSIHRCYPLWNTMTHLTRFPAVPGILDISNY